MEKGFLQEEIYLLNILRCALQSTTCPQCDTKISADMGQIITIAEKHAVLSLLFHYFENINVAQTYKQRVETEALKTTLQNYRLLFLTKYLVHMLQEADIPVIVLKGVSTAVYYPCLELRKSGDIDLLIPKTTKADKVKMLMQTNGFQLKDEQHAGHHLEFQSNEGITIELHTDFTERFAYRKLNTYMKRHMADCFETVQTENFMGVTLPVLNKPFHAYELLLHMLHHLLYAGFGLKLLCDWVVLWRAEWLEEEKACFKMLVQESGCSKFAEIVTCTCACYLGLDAAAFAWEINGQELPIEDFLREILDAEEFGSADNSRMVMTAGADVISFLKEFHHQMRLNFPKAGNCFFLWPVLWCITLARFLHNNRKIRNVSTRQVIREAKRRSVLMKKMKLFE